MNDDDLRDLEPASSDGFRAARRSLGLSVYAMSDVLGMGANGPRTIRRWEGGDRPPHPVAAQVVRWLLDGFRPPGYPEPR